MGLILCCFFLSLPFLTILDAPTVLLKGGVCTALKRGGYKNRSTGGKEIRRGGKREEGPRWGLGLERKSFMDKCGQMDLRK